MDETLFITALLNLEVVGNCDVDIEIMPGINITNDSQLVSNCITDNLTKCIGQLESEALSNSKAVIYGIVPATSYGNLTQQQFLLANLIFVETFLQATWLIKDNSINYELAFIETPFKKNNSTVSSNFLASLHTNASGQVHSCVFTAPELIEAIKLHESVYTFVAEKEKNLKNFLQKGNPRIARAFHFLEAARSEGNPGFKVAHYCTCFETLFSTSSVELSHKLSERIASFLGNSGDEKFTIYQEIKSAYNIRSKVVHGDNLSNDQVDNLALISVSCDKYIRSILGKIVTDNNLKNLFAQKNDSLEDHFVKLVFGLVDLEPKI